MPSGEVVAVAVVGPPLGVTVTIEVLGPLVLSLVAARRAAAWLWAVLAFAGVVALGGGGWDRLDVWGVLFALGAAASWAFYILSSARVAPRSVSVDTATSATTSATVRAPESTAPVQDMSPTVR